MGFHARQLLGSLSALPLLVAGAAAPGQAAPPPAPWVAQNFGLFEAGGRAEVDFAGLWTLQASHGLAAGNRDSLFLVHQTLRGDGSVLALLLGQEGGNREWGRAGIAILEPRTLRGAQLSMTGGHGLAFVYRGEVFRPLLTEVGERRYAPRRLPIWLRLQREGAQLTPFMSLDGFGWTQIRPPLFLRRLQQDVLAGLAVASVWGGTVQGRYSTPLVVPGRLSPLVQVCSGNGSVQLTWPPTANARGYLVRRGSDDDADFAADLITPVPITANSYTDHDLVPGRPVRYLVSALFQEGSQTVEGWPTAVDATPHGAPGELLACDLNSQGPRLQGSITFDPATTAYEISGAGAGYAGREDHGYFAFRRLEGDFQITVRLLEQPRGIAGLMVRETLGGAARASFLGVIAEQGLVFQSRLTAGERPYAPDSPLLPPGQLQPPLYLRLVRRGNTVTPLMSRNGVSFRWAGAPITFDSPLARGLYVGYTVASGDPEAYGRSRFSDLNMSAP